MFTDMVAFSALTQRDEPLALKLVDEQQSIVRPVFGRFAGREVKTMGDGALVEFESALDATECAVEMQPFPDALLRHLRIPRLPVSYFHTRHDSGSNHMSVST